MAVGGAIVIVIGILLGGVLTEVWSRAERQARVVAGVRASLDEATDWLANRRWKESAAAAGRAALQVTKGNVPDALRAEVNELIADARMGERLEEVRMQRGGVQGGGFDLAAEDRGYQEAFREYGIDVDALPVAKVTSSLASRRIRTELAAALDGWAVTRLRSSKQGQKTRHELLVLANAVDPNPERNNLRDAILRNDRQTLVHLAASLDSPSLQPMTALLLAACLEDAGHREEGIGLLRKARSDSPMTSC